MDDSPEQRFKNKFEETKGGEVKLSGSFSWNGTNPLFNDVHLEIKKGSFVVIMGRVGSGKSTLVNSILGETRQMNGRRAVNGRIAYVPQSSWLQNVSIRENILFEDAYDQKLYELVLKSCALQEDFVSFKDGDQTVIGDNGMNLSEGQKQRISIARSLYKDADIYIFDNPLSSVDALVGEHIFHHVISDKGILKNKTRILVTNNFKLLKSAEKIIVVDNGKIIQNQSSTQSLLEKINLKEIHVKNTDENIIKDQVNGKHEARDENIQYKIGNNWKSYINYVNSAGLSSSILILFLYLTGNLFPFLSNIVLVNWADNVHNTTSQLWHVRLFVIIGVLGIIYEIIRNIVFSNTYTKASNVLHKNLLENVMHYPMLFFEKYSDGEILNRFSSDVAVVDDEIPAALRVLFIAFFKIVSVIALISYSAPAFIIYFLPFLLLFLFVKNFYVKTTRLLSKMETDTRSSLTTQVNEAVTGASVIRAFKEEKRKTAKFYDTVGKNLKPFYFKIMAYRWLSIRMEVMLSFIILFTSLLIISNKDVSPGFLGLIMSYVLTLISKLSFVTHATFELETNSMSLDRIYQFTHEECKLESDSDNFDISKNWPSSGKIIFSKVNVKYKNSPMILKNINFAIGGKEKIGVCGRTGSGKSTLTICLFRLLEVVSGKITIDGIDIRHVGLQKLRRCLCIIPQNPILFTGTIRFNLDPENCRSNDEIWSALHHAQLDEVIAQFDRGLDHEISENGSDLSIGQRQLLCLARALLRRNKILVLDEATAALDQKSDSQIQSTIRKKFSDCTIISVAHRIKTILDYDKILVLDDGVVVEFDEPKNLLKNRNSMFYDLAKKDGIFE